MTNYIGAAVAPFEKVVETAKNAGWNGHKLGNAADVFPEAFQAAGRVWRASEGEAENVTETVGVQGMRQAMGMFESAGQIGYNFAGQAVKDSITGVVEKLPAMFRWPVTPLVRWLFGPLDNFGPSLIQRGGRVVTGLLPGWITFLDWVLPHTMTVHELSHNIRPGSPNLAPIEAQIQRNNAAIAHLNYEIARINAKISRLPTANPNLGPTLEDQIQRIEGQIATIAHDLTYLHTHTSAADEAIPRLQNEINDLSQNLKGVRQTVAGWPQVQHDIEQSVTRVSTRTDTLGNDLSKLTATVAPLLALRLLLQPGPKGLKILRKLEDQPCLCPKFGGIPNEVGTALALYEYMTNG